MSHGCFSAHLADLAQGQFQDQDHVLVSLHQGPDQDLGPVHGLLDHGPGPGADLGLGQGHFLGGERQGLGHDHVQDPSQNQGHSVH